MLPSASRPARRPGSVVTEESGAQAAGVDRVGVERAFAAERGGRRAGCAAPRAGQCLDGSVRFGGLGAHGAGRELGPVLAREPELPVQLVAKSLRIVDRQGYEGSGDVAAHALDDDADLLHLVLDVVGRHEAVARVVRQGLGGHGIGLLRWRRPRTAGRRHVPPGAAPRGMVSDGPAPPEDGGPAIRMARARLKPRAASVRGCAREPSRRGRRRGRATRRSRRCSPCA